MAGPMGVCKRACATPLRLPYYAFSVQSPTPLVVDPPASRKSLTSYTSGSEMSAASQV
jgi:hypothetical protein